LVLNDTRVSARRLSALRENGQPAEVLLLQPEGPSSWTALVKPGKRIRVGSALCVWIEHDRFVEATVSGHTREGGRILEFQDPAVARSLATLGDAPLPPYIHAKLDDEERYQTVYGLVPGSAAAPTAGLHFTPDTLTDCRNKGVRIAWTTLHVGIDTF